MRPIDLLCDLIEAGEGRFRRRAFDGRGAFDPLIRAGMVVADGVTASVVCDACGEPHPVSIERDPPSGGYRWHCPDAGTVPVSLEDVALVCIDNDAVVDRIAAALGASRRRRPPLVPGHAWLLGDFAVGATDATGVLASRVQDSAALARLCDALAALHPAVAAFVFVTGDVAAGGLPLPNGFRVVLLGEVAAFDAAGTLTVDKTRLGRLIARVVKRGSAAGRPSGAKMVEQVRRSLVDGGRTYASRNDEARAIREAWPTRFPDVEAPAHNTVLGHLRKGEHSRASR